MNTQDYLGSIIKPLLAQPEQLFIQESKDEMGVLYSIQVAQDDMGRVIGREGETAKALRHIVRVQGMTHQSRVSLKFMEPIKQDA